MKGAYHIILRESLYLHLYRDLHVLLYVNSLPVWLNVRKSCITMGWRYRKELLGAALNFPEG